MHQSEQSLLSAESIALLGAHGKLKASDAMILQDRDIDVRDLRVGQEDQPLIAGGQTRPGLGCAKVQGVEPLSGERHDLEAYMRVVVLTAELSNSFSEGPAEECHVEHSTAIGRLAQEVKRSSIGQGNDGSRASSTTAVVRVLIHPTRV